MNGTKSFTFSYSSYDNEDIRDEFAIDDSFSRSLTYDDAIAWPSVLRDFVTFLGSVYGYDISDQVQFRNFSDRVAQLMEDLEDYDDQSEEASSL